ncbi:hypothetical protein PIB30_005219 [Stylosanthes scabra]|uniref:Uncharacterized protein n=1 Tax=Stylosanthes scabra TaxID=79078 RepID=A0ABU6S3E1_9FABA|nr:hypothetical protein [Stylosanthes scabra]
MVVQSKDLNRQHRYSLGVGGHRRTPSTAASPLYMRYRCSSTCTSLSSSIFLRVRTHLSAAIASAPDSGGFASGYGLSLSSLQPQQSPQWGLPECLWQRQKNLHNRWCEEIWASDEKSAGPINPVLNLRCAGSRHRGSSVDLVDRLAFQETFISLKPVEKLLPEHLTKPHQPL